jgi:hypothetical protein
MRLRLLLVLTCALAPLLGGLILSKYYSGILDLASNHRAQLRAFFVQIRERLLTETAYVALDADAFDEKVQSFLASLEPFGDV